MLTRLTRRTSPEAPPQLNCHWQVKKHSEQKQVGKNILTREFISGKTCPVCNSRKEARLDSFSLLRRVAVFRSRVRVCVQQGHSPSRPAPLHSERMQKDCFFLLSRVPCEIIPFFSPASRRTSCNHAGAAGMSESIERERSRKPFCSLRGFIIIAIANRSGAEERKKREREKAQKLMF